jgi:hypothetical protein
MTIKSYNGDDSMTELTPKSEIYLRITEIISASKKRIFNSLNSEIVKTYWMIGKEILEEEQQGQERAKYGSDLINKLSKKNVEPFETKINLNIPNKKVFDMLIDNADEDREELIKTIAKVAVSQIEIDKLQEYLTEEVSIFINNYYNG